MSTPSCIAAATLGFRDLIQTAMPPGVEVSTQPAAQAEQFVERTGLLAGVNLVLYQVSASPSRGNAFPVRHGPRPSVMARIAPQSLSGAEVRCLFSSMHAVYRPTLAYLLALSDS
jgi:hypothetical protein